MMSAPPQMSTPLSSFKSILDEALSEYKKNTGMELLDQPLASEVQHCDTVAAVLTILQDQAKAFQQFEDGDQRLMKWIGPSVQVLFAFSGTLGMGDHAGLTFPPAKGIIIGILVLLSAAKDVKASHHALVELFERIEKFFKPLGDYIRISLTTEMAEVFVKITAKVISVLSIATKEVGRWRARIYFRNLSGRIDIEDAFKTLDILKQELIRMAMAQVMKVTSEFKEDSKEANLAIANNVNEIMWNQKGLDIRNWFTPPDPSTNHNTACKVYHNVPSMWFFGADLFNDWMSNGSLLWVHGNSGSGKTVLSSAIIQHIMRLGDARQAALAYYYFDFRDKEKQNIRNLITSILVQLSACSHSYSDIIHRLYLSHGNGTRQPSDGALMGCLKSILTVALEPPIFIIIDALDECSDTPETPNQREAILDIVKDLAHPRRPNVHLCVTSRPEVDLQTKLEPLSVNAVSLHGQSGRKTDISNYVGSVVFLDENLKKLREEDKKLVVEELSERADGVFQWVFCQLETLRRSVESDVRGVLERLPKNLDETYGRVLEDVSENNQERARLILQCLSVAVRPLRVEELAEILAFDFHGAESGIPTFEVDQRPENQEEALLSACSSLITIVNDGDSRMVQFSHLSVKEFLMSNHLASSSGDISQFHILPTLAHTTLAQVCLGFLLHSEDNNDESLKGSPLARYAAQYWVTHAQFEDVASSVAVGMKSLFDPDRPYFAAWLKTYDMDRQSDGTSQGEMPNPLYYAALCGFDDLVKYLAIKYPQHVNAIAGFYEFPLVAALCQRHLRVAGILLEHGGAVDVRGRGETALHKIIQRSEEVTDAVQFLLEHGADVNARREDLWTPLHLAVVNGELKVVRMLLEHHADVNSRNDEGLTPLHLFSRQAIPLLEDNASILTAPSLEGGTNVNPRAKDNMTPLHLASYNQRLEIVRALLDHGANVDAENDEGRTPLQELFRGNRHSHDVISAARLLLARGAETYARDKYHVTASDVAFCFGEEKIWPVLLNYGEDFNPDNDQDRIALQLWLKECATDRSARDKYDTMLLHSASYHGRHGMVQELLDHDVNVNVKNHRGETALHVVSRGKDDSQDGVRVAQLLLDCGADVSMVLVNDHRTPLHAACYSARLDIAQVLLDHDANANAEDIFLRKPLHYVACGEYESKASGARLAQLLLEHGVDVNAPDKYLWTPLHLACNNDLAETVQVLLDHGAKANMKNDLGAAPLHVVSRGKFSKDGVHIAQLLLDHGADANARRNDHCTPLHELSFSGRFDIVRLLLDHGAIANAEDSFLRTPLHTVSQGAQESEEDGIRTAQLLLERGVDVNARDKNRETPLHLASANGRLEIMRVLLDHTTVKNDHGQMPLQLGLEKRDVDVNAQRRDHQTPLHVASHRGKPESVQLLLERGANPNMEDSLLRTPLQHVALGHYQSEEDGVRVAQLLLEHSADINVSDVNRDTPLHSASSSGRLEMARILLERATVKNDRGQNPSHLSLKERGINVDARKKDHCTPLHIASHYGKPEVTRLLLDHGANPNAEDNFFRTPLHQVARGQYQPQDGVRVSQLLLECSVDVNAKDINGETPLHLACSSGRLEIVRVLLEHTTVKNYRGQSPTRPNLEEPKVEVNARRADDWTPLHVASYFGRPEIAQALLLHGASANAENNIGETPLYLASRGEYRSQDEGVCITRLLLEHGGNADTNRKDHSTPLQAASYWGRSEIVRLLLDHGANPNATNRQGKNSLDIVSRGEYGSEEDGVRVAQLLLDRGVDVNAQDQDHWTPLHSASYYGRPEIVRLFLDHGAKANSENDDGETPLVLVSRGEYQSHGDGVHIARLLLDRGADVNGRPNAQWTPLNWASHRGRLGIVQVLVDRGATLNAESQFLRTPLHAVSGGEYESQEDRVGIARLLLERGVDVNAQEINSETPLSLAAFHGKIELARVLLDHGAVVTQKAYDGKTPLHVVPRGKSDSEDDVRLTELLFERGADVNAPDQDLDTPLHSACIVGRLDIARVLLDHGATATAKNCRGETPLHVTSRGDYKSRDGVHLARLLLEHGADVSAQDKGNVTPLHFASCNGKSDIAQLLLSHGAAANAKDMQGQTPLHVLSPDGIRVARVLLEHGVDVNIRDTHHRTPLGTASFHGNLEIARVLLDNGAKVNARDDYGWTPLHLLSQYQGDPEDRGIGVARLLLERGADTHLVDINHMTPLDLLSRRGWSKMVQALSEHENKAKLA